MQRRGDHRRHEPAGHLIGEPLDRRARLRCALATICDDMREQRVAADLFRAHDETAGAVERAADHLCAGLLVTGMIRR